MNWLKAIADATSLERLLDVVNQYLLAFPEEHWAWIPREGRPRLVASAEELQAWHRKLSDLMGSASQPNIRLQDLVNMTDKKQIQEVVSSWPAYRGAHFVVRTMQWRLYDCFWQMRLPEMQYVSDVSIALTTYLHYQGNGAIMKVPGFKR